MGTPQSGIFDDTAAVQIHLEYSLKPDANRQTLMDAVRQLTSIGPVVLGFGTEAWELLSGLGPDVDVRDFPGFGEDARKAPSTQRDVWVWLQAADLNLTTELARSAHASLQGVADLALEQLVFKREEMRGFEGFIDGTANPSGTDAETVALIPVGQPGEGGSFAMTQRWEHDLVSFGALGVSEQERVIGRTKAESVELEGDAMPEDSHVSRTDVKVGGVAQEIYRRSLPFGTANSHGLFFVAFASSLTRFDHQLNRMFGTFGDGLHDRLIEFSLPLTGSYWYVPSVEQLDQALLA